MCVCGGGGGGGGATMKVDTFSFKKNVNCQVGASVDAALLGGCLTFDENWMVGAHHVGHTHYTPKEEEHAGMARTTLLLLHLILVERQDTACSTTPTR